MVYRRPSTNRRLHARNFIKKEAQKRLDEVVLAYNNQVENSLYVNAVHGLHFRINRVAGRPCSCFKSDIPAIGNVGNLPNKHDESVDTEAQFQDDAIFGTSLADQIFNDEDVLNLEDVHANDYNDTSTSASANCGICYRTLRQPGFIGVNAQYMVLTHYDIKDVSGYHIDSGAAPHALKKEARNGTVTFTITVPINFVSCIYSVRNNVDILNEPIFVGDKPLTRQILEKYKGKRLEITCRADMFTHITILFDMGAQLNLNIGGETTVLDYDTLQTLSDFPVVFGPSTQMVEDGDMVFLPERGICLKINSVERKITSKERRLEWVCSSRALQPTEPLRKMLRGQKL